MQKRKKNTRGQKNAKNAFFHCGLSLFGHGVLYTRISQPDQKYNQLMGQDSPSSTITVFSTSRVFHWKNDSQRLRQQSCKLGES